MRVFPVASTMAEQAAVFDYLATLSTPDLHTGSLIQAPILLLPNVFESDLCRKLIDVFEVNGAAVAAFVSQEAGRTVFVTDRNIKTRRDYHVVDPSLIEAIRARIGRRVVPEIHSGRDVSGAGPFL